jgi:ABC-type methionine transport system ATPase subunit
VAKKIMHLIFPQKLIKEPVIYTMAKKYNVIPSIRRAKVTESIGEVTLELSGRKDNLDEARRYLERQGIKVQLITGDIIE